MVNNCRVAQYTQHSSKSAQYKMCCSASVLKSPKLILRIENGKKFNGHKNINNCLLKHIIKMPLILLEIMSIVHKP